jgi:tape measure domain-containing protein
MAKGKNEILLSIALEGDADVKAKLKAVGEVGKQSMADIERRVGTAGEGFGRNLAKQAAEPLSKVREALAPFLEGAGFSAAGGGLIARLFGAAGPAAAVAGVSAIALHVAKVSEDLQRQQGRLKALGDSDGFEKISAQAKQLGTNVGALQPRYEKFIASQQKANAANVSVIHPPGFEPGPAEESAAGVRIVGAGPNNTPPSKKNFQAFDSALFKQARRDVKSAEEAHAIVGQFEDGLAQNGLTGDSLRSLQEQAPHAANFVKDSLSPRLGRGFANPNELAALLDRGGAQVSGPDLINSGAKAAPEADKAAEATRGVTQAFEGLTASVGRLDEAIGKVTGGPINKSLTGGIDTVTGGVEKAADIIVRQQGSIERGAALGSEFTTSRAGFLPVPFKGTIGAVAGGAIGGAVGVGGDLARSAYDNYAPDFLKKALTDPGALQEKVRPATGPSALEPVPVPPVPPQQQSSAFDRFIENLNAKINGLNPPNLKVDGPVTGLGIRGSLEDGTQSVKTAGADLAAAIDEIAANIKNGAAGGAGKGETTVTLAGGGSVRRFPNGGGVSGPGTSTSDSIPAMLSDGEYVLRAQAARKLGRSRLDFLNAANFADGGSLDDRLLDGWRASENRRNSKEEAEAQRAFIRAIKPRERSPVGAPPADQIVNLDSSGRSGDTMVWPVASDFKGSAFAGDSDWERWQLYVTDPPQRAGGGPIGRFAAGGAVGGLDLGRMVSFPGLDLAGPSFMNGAPGLPQFGAGGAESLHPVTINFEGRPVGGLRAPGDVVDTLRKEARDSANFQTGQAPSWAHGT